jgi:hypothetical protein
VLAGSKNFAKPLNVSGFVTGNLVPFTGSAGPGLLVEFSYDNPNAKVVGTGVFIVIDEINGQPLYLEVITPRPQLPGVQALPEVGDWLTGRHCKSRKT